MGKKEKEGREGEGRGGERMLRGPESGLPRGQCWLSAGLVTHVIISCLIVKVDNVFCNCCISVNIYIFLRHNMMESNEQKEQQN